MLYVSCRTSRAALRHDIARTTFAFSTLSRHAQLELNFFKTHAGPCMANDFTVRDSVADADDHVMGLLNKEGFRPRSINANPSHLQLTIAEQGFSVKNQLKTS